MSEIATQCAEEHAKQAEKLLSFAPFALAACGLYASSLYSYLLFHTLVEIFCVFVMLAVFLLSWNSRRLLDNHYFLFIAISFITSGALEVLHTFAYKGIGIFPGYDANLPTQFWIAFRYVFSLSFLAAPVFITRKVNVAATLTAFTVVTAILISAIFAGYFPDCFIEGRGLTPFKVYSEYLIIVFLLASIALLRLNRKAFHPRVLSTLILAIVSAMAADAAFTKYISVYGPANLLGHLFLFLSAFLIYRAIVVTGIREPATLLFRSLKLSQQALKNSEERLHFALETSHIGAWDLDLVEHTAFRSAEHDRIFGYAELQPKWNYEIFLEHVVPEDRAEVQRKFSLATDRQADWSFECRIRRTDSELRWIWVAGRYRSTASGGLRGMTGLIQDITERKRAEEALQKAHNELAKQMEQRTGELREKEVLLKEIHHRVKNNLQVISSLVSLQAEGSTDQTVRDVLQDVMYRVRSMALVHEKLYQSADLARVDFAEYSESLLHYLWQAHGAAAAKVRLTLEMEPLSLPVDCAVPCGLILNELAGNALKHAFRGRNRGEVTLSLGSIGERTVRLRVRDDGVGLPSGLNWRETGTLGLRLVQMLAGQLSATVQVNSLEGTEFEIIFKQRSS